MNRYGATVMRQWARLLPEVYAEIRNPSVFFGVLGEQIAQRIDELADELAGDDMPGEGYLAKVGRLTAARCRAEEMVMHDYGLLPPDGEDDGDEDSVLTAAGERPVAVDRDHPSWAEVDAEQRERVGDPAAEEGRS
ncbi:MAG: hypothetical protein JO345_22455 [Streptosporangiaceae bacterium]|nr:hypothetical protein [Streptosporangiaceae bacterium]